MKLLQTSILRFAIFLAIFIGLKSLIAWGFIFDWRDLIFAAIWTIVSVRQSLVKEKREKEADKLAEQSRKNESW